MEWLNNCQKERFWMTNLYYTPPTDEQFAELKEKAIKIWHTYDSDDPRDDYAETKIKSIQDLKNVGDNFMYLVAMFDYINMRKLARMISPTTRQAVRDRMIDGGSFEYLIDF